MQDSQHDENDARQQQRSGALTGALILAGADKPATHCLITNISAEGAELEMTSDVRVPAHFTLHVPHQGVAYRAQVRWRENGRIGVMFNGRDDNARPALRKVVG